MTTDYKQYLVSPTPKETELAMQIPCSKCHSFDSAAICYEHDAHIERIPITVRPLPWSLKNQKLSLSISWDDNGRRFFDGDFYIRECLKYMVVNAPWGATTDVFLLQVGDNPLGKALQDLVPQAFAENQAGNTNPDTIKKG